MTRGFLLGKFLPPHNGHVLLGDFARAYADEITILVCTLDRDPIPGKLRATWMRELFPTCRVLHLDRDVPQEPAEHPAFWAIWREIVREAHPEPIDFVFASEAYGHRLATELRAAFVPVDPLRLAAPVSGTRVRDNPFACWAHLPVPVRAHYVKTVCLFGPESSGKTTLATSLALHFNTTLVPEYGRTYTDTFGTDVAADDLQRIAIGHRAMTAAAKRHANKILICDTDPVLTAVWADMLLGQRPAELDIVAEPSDLYLLTDIDFPWIDDGTRYFADRAIRQRFFDLCRTELERRRLPYVVVAGTPEARLNAAVAAVLSILP